MTTATFFPGSSSSSSATGKRFAPAAPLASQAVTRAAAKAPRALVGAASVYPWMTQAMLSGMSPRACRLLRADY